MRPGLPRWQRARRLLALEYRARIELAFAGIELHTDVRRNHGPEIGNVLVVIYPKKDEHQRIPLAPGGNSATEQENDSADETSSHCAREQSLIHVIYRQ